MALRHALHLWVHTHRRLLLIRHAHGRLLLGWRHLLH